MFSINIERETLKNTYYRKVLSTNKFQQLVVMSLKPGEDIPLESHDGSQFIRIESGRGIAKTNKKNTRLKDGMSIIIPPNTKHYIKNTTKKPLKLYSVYSPPQHPKETKQRRQPIE